MRLCFDVSLIYGFETVQQAQTFPMRSLVQSFAVQYHTNLTAAVHAHAFP